MLTTLTWGLVLDFQRERILLVPEGSAEIYTKFLPRDATHARY